jgi:hypothetical protein
MNYLGNLIITRKLFLKSNCLLLYRFHLAPTFTSPINNDKIDVNEDSADGFLVKTLKASDEDGDPLTYTLVSQVCVLYIRICEDLIV